MECAILLQDSFLKLYIFSVIFSCYKTIYKCILTIKNKKA